MKKRFTKFKVTGCAAVFTVAEFYTELGGTLECVRGTMQRKNGKTYQICTRVSDAIAVGGVTGKVTANQERVLTECRVSAANETTYTIQAAHRFAPAARGLEKRGLVTIKRRPTMLGYTTLYEITLKAGA